MPRAMNPRTVARSPREVGRCGQPWWAGWWHGGVSANAISVAGMLCGLAAGGALAGTPWAGGWAVAVWLAAAVLIQLRLLANLLDGMVAVASGTASPLGELYNEVPDRFSDAAILIGAGYAVGGDIALGYLAACGALLTAYVRAVGKVAGAPQDYSGPMAKQQRMLVIALVAVASGVLPADWLPTWEGRGLVAAGLAVVIVGTLLTTLRRLLRIARCLKNPGPVA